MGKHMEDVRDMLCDELDKFGQQGELTAGSLDTIDKLAHSIKSIDTIMAMEDSGYSRDDGRMMHSNGVNSYANRRRDSRGRYSRGYYGGSYDDGVTAQLEEIMESAPDHHTRKVIQDAIKKIGE